MNVEEARDLRPGDKVVYSNSPLGPWEDGWVTKVTDEWVFVLYRGCTEPMATPHAQLERVEMPGSSRETPEEW